MCPMRFFIECTNSRYRFSCKKGKIKAKNKFSILVETKEMDILNDEIIITFRFKHGRSGEARYIVQSLIIVPPSRTDTNLNQSQLNRNNNKTKSENLKNAHLYQLLNKLEKIWIAHYNHWTTIKVNKLLGYLVFALVFACVFSMIYIGYAPLPSGANRHDVIPRLGLNSDWRKDFFPYP
ncbi:hypothetical protein SNEBB_003173 [Seison nebaliae]|nr:hypothetical protein SNEBB_003173 [Seison nebaliae]